MISKEEIMNNIIVVLVTTMGTLEIELYEDDAPITVKNFVSYVESGFFEETIFPVSYTHLTLPTNREV